MRILKITSLLTLVAPFIFSCAKNEKLKIEVTDQIISSNYLGNGAEWDPYDEAEAWGSPVSDADWEKLYHRLDFMKMGYVRCMINSPWRYYNEKGEYDKTRNIRSISKLLQYCTDNNIEVVYGEYNPPVWDMKGDQRWVDMSVDYLNYLVNDLGFNCIKYFVIFNEPDGHWASTNGDFVFWQNMLKTFDAKIKSYPSLAQKVKFAGPDVVVEYKNDASPFDSEGWIAQSAQEIDSLIGIYDVHAYPGQKQVRSGDFGKELSKYKRHIPEGKQIVLGEAGYKYHRPEDSILMREYSRRTENHPYTKGSDCNMLVYDYFYGVDMPLLCIETMNAGYSGIASWMLDDAMHSNGDSGKTEDIKLWGMWNILGEEVFGKETEEEIRPWYYTWSLMCRYFPNGATIHKTTELKDYSLFSAAANWRDQQTIAIVNVGEEDREVEINLNKPMKNVKLFTYTEEKQFTDKKGLPYPVQTGIDIPKSYKISIKANSFALLTEMDLYENYTL